MDDGVDQYLSRLLKKWVAQRKPATYSRARLILAASHASQEIEFDKPVISKFVQITGLFQETRYHVDIPQAFISLEIVHSIQIGLIFSRQVV
jgi:hypothetical protein